MSRRQTVMGEWAELAGDVMALVAILQENEPLRSDPLIHSVMPEIHEGIKLTGMHGT